MTGLIVPTPARAAVENPGIPSLLSALWEKYLPLMQERLALLDAAAEATRTGELDAQQRSSAIDAAHKFAGSLGMFGFPQGTDAARSMEHLLLETEGFDGVSFRKLVRDLHNVLGF